MSYLIWYPPLCFAVFVMLEMCKEDEPKVILKRAGKNFGLLTAVFVGGSAIFYALNRWL